MADPKITLSAVDRSQAAFDSVDRHFEGLQKRAAAFGASVGKLAVALGAIGAVGVVVNVKSAIDASDALAKLSQRVGLSVESLSTLRFAAELADVNLDALANGIKKLQVNMADAQRGTGEAVDAFKALNLNIEQSPGKLKITEELLLEIAEKFAGFEDGANKTALAIKIFGRAGADLIPFLNQGRDGIERLREEAERLGLTISGKTAAQAEKFNDDLTALGRSARALAQDLAVKVLPALTRITGEMREAAKQGGLLKAAFAGISALFENISPFGDLQRAEKELVDVTDRILANERKLSGLGTSSFAEQAARGLEQKIAADKKRAEELIKLLGVLRGETNALGDPLATTPPAQPKPQAPALVDPAAAKRAAAEQERDAKERERALSDFRRKADLDRARAVEFEQSLEKKHRAQLEAERKELEALGQSYIDLIDPVEKYRRKLSDIEYLIERGVLDPTQGELAREKIEQSVRDLSGVDEAAKELGLTFSSAFEEAIVGGNNLRDVLRGLEQDIIRIATRRLVTEPLSEFVSKSVSGGGLADLAKSFFSFLIPKAAGGPVFAGQEYLVGEKGPELFRPRSSGTIVPNDRMRGGNTYHINVAIPPGTSQETALQMAARTASMLQYAQGYNG